MKKSQPYDFKILFNKIDEVRNSGGYSDEFQSEIFQQVDKDIQELKEYIECINETDYQTFTRS